jgi:hypothetical protein
MGRKITMGNLGVQSASNDTAPVFPAAPVDIAGMTLTVPASAGEFSDWMVYFTALLLGPNGDGAVAATIVLTKNGSTPLYTGQWQGTFAAAVANWPQVSPAVRVQGLIPGDVIAVEWQALSIAPPYDTGGVAVGQGFGDRSLVMIQVG